MSSILTNYGAMVAVDRFSQPVDDAAEPGGAGVEGGGLVEGDARADRQPVRRAFRHDGDAIAGEGDDLSGQGAPGAFYKDAVTHADIAAKAGNGEGDTAGGVEVAPAFNAGDTTEAGCEVLELADSRMGRVLRKHNSVNSHAVCGRQAISRRWLLGVHRLAPENLCENVWTCKMVGVMEFRRRHPSQELRTEMLDRIDLFRLADSRLRYLSDRQAVIARNIANADTPHYAARDLSRFSFDSALTNRATADAAQPVTLARTSASHIDLPTSGAPGAKSGKAARAYSEDISGNKVSLEEQMVKAADTMNAFSLASSAYAKSIAIMKLSIGSNR